MFSLTEGHWEGKYQRLHAELERLREQLSVARQELAAERQRADEAETKVANAIEIVAGGTACERHADEIRSMTFAEFYARQAGRGCERCTWERAEAAERQAAGSVAEAGALSAALEWVEAQIVVPLWRASVHVVTSEQLQAIERFKEIRARPDRGAGWLEAARRLATAIRHLKIHGTGTRCYYCQMPNRDHAKECALKAAYAALAEWEKVQHGN